MKNFFFFVVIIFVFIFLIHLSFPVFSQEKNNLLLTNPRLKFNAETDITAPLNVQGSINILNIDGLKGEIKISNLTENRSYLFPNASGEVCLSTGNCQFAQMSIKNLFRGLAIFIDEEGKVGIGREHPEYKLHVEGRVHATDDICTDLAGKKCLSELGELSAQISSIEKATETGKEAVKGGGAIGRIPLWKDSSVLENSIIYQADNNIGIGMNPVYKLDVAGTVRMLGFRLPVSPKKGYGLLSDEYGFGTWQPVLTPLGSGADVAENFPIDPECKKINNCPEPGDLVIINEKKFIEKSKIPYDSRLIGIISSEPNLTLAGNLDPASHRPVALIGKVPTKVSLEGGEIKPGDFLTSSFLEGVAKKANKPGRVIGVALDSLSEDDFKNCENKKIIDCQNKIGEIETLINLTQIINQ